MISFLFSPTLNYIMDYSLILNRFLVKARNKRIIYIVIILAFVLILYQLWRVAAIFTVSDTLQNATLADMSIKKLPPIAKWHLFGHYQQINQGMLPETQLNLTLEGVIYSTKPAASQALITAPGMPVEVYSIGDYVSGSAKIKEIYPDRVVLEQGGQLQNLRLKQPELEFALPLQQVK